MTIVWDSEAYRTSSSSGCGADDYKLRITLPDDPCPRTHSTWMGEMSYWSVADGIATAKTVPVLFSINDRQVVITEHRTSEETEPRFTFWGKLKRESVDRCGCNFRETIRMIGQSVSTDDETFHINTVMHRRRRHHNV